MRTAKKIILFIYNILFFPLSLAGAILATPVIVFFLVAVSLQNTDKRLKVIAILKDTGKQIEEALLKRDTDESESETVSIEFVRHSKKYKSEENELRDSGDEEDDNQ